MVIILFLLYFDICIKHTLLAIILTIEKSHLMFELHDKTAITKISYKKSYTTKLLVIAKLKNLGS